MARKSSDDGNKRAPKRVYSPATCIAIHHQMKSHMPRFTSTNNNDNVLDSHAKKRIKVEKTEATSRFNRTRFPTMLETQCSTSIKVIEGATRTAFDKVKTHEEKKQKMGIDHFKKMQCSVTLKRLMVHPNAWPFKKQASGKALEIYGYSDIESKPLMDLESVKWKLEKGLYMETDQFAADIRLVFSNAMLYYPPRHEVHRIAVKLSELFETKWKALEEKWVAEKAKVEEEKPKAKSKEGKKRKSLCDPELSTQKAMDINANVVCQGMEERGVAQKNLFSCNVDLQRKKEREMLLKMERTISIDDNLKSFEELEQLCGHSLSDCTKGNSLKEIIGLALKEELLTLPDFDEDKFLSADWEEGEIMCFN